MYLFIKKFIVFSIILLGGFFFANYAQAADRYWVGGTASWDGTANSEWATTSGGAGGAAEPTASDDVYFDGNSGSGTVTVSTTTALTNNLNFTGFTGTLAGFTAITISGSLTLGSGMTMSYGGPITFNATSGIHSLTTNGISLLYNVTFDGVGGTWTLQDNFTSSGGIIYLNNGTFNANNFNVSIRSFRATGVSTARTLNMGSGMWTISDATSAWVISLPSDTLTLNADTSTIKFTSNTSTTISFSGGNKTYYNVWFDRGTASGINNISTTSTFNELKDTGTAAHTLSFITGSTNTFSSFVVSGSVGNLITIKSSTGSTSVHNLVMTGGGVVSGDYLSIQNSVATPSSSWYAGTHSTDNQAVATAGSGWIFTDPPDITAPTITNVSSDKTNGSYNLGEVIDIDVTFSEAVTSTGNVTVTLETGITDRTCTFAVTNSTTGTCNYTVQVGDSSLDLTTNNIAGTIADQASNAMSNFTPTTNLATNKDLVIVSDSTAPTLAESSAIGLSFDTTPTYTFTTDEAGIITYGGSCSSAITSATLGINTITLNELALGLYSNCTITVTDTIGNVSSILTLSAFSVNAHGAVSVASLPQTLNQNTNPQNTPNAGCTTDTKFSPTTGLLCTNFIPISTCPTLPGLPRILKLNLVHGTVKVLQQILNCRGYTVTQTGAGSIGKETFKFGPATKRALIIFQKKYNLTPDGILGPMTRMALEKLSK